MIHNVKGFGVDLKVNGSQPVAVGSRQHLYGEYHGGMKASGDSVVLM